MRFVPNNQPTGAGTLAASYQVHVDTEGFVVNQGCMRRAVVRDVHKSRFTVEWANSSRTCTRKVGLALSFGDWLKNPNGLFLPLANLTPELAQRVVLNLGRQNWGSELADAIRAAQQPRDVVNVKGGVS